jgi:endonuclease YncB( thermonuclease family)
MFYQPPAKGIQVAKPNGLLNFPKDLWVGYGPYMACVDRVIDGDTFVAHLDFGARLYFTLGVRLYGINAPETSEGGWLESKEYLSQLLPRDTPCLIRSWGYSWGRIVGSVALADGRDVASEMVAAGHAMWASY